MKNGFSDEVSLPAEDVVSWEYTATIERPTTVMRPIATNEDSSLADEFIMHYVLNDWEKLDELVPGGKMYDPVSVAEDGSGAEFDVYVEDHIGWPDNRTEKPIGRVFFCRKAATTVKEEDVVA
jgi:hypothetical protein